MVLIIIYFICTSDQSGKFHVKYINVYIEPLIDEYSSYGMASLCMTYKDKYSKRNFNSMQWLYGQYTMPLG